MSTSPSASSAYGAAWYVVVSMVVVILLLAAAYRFRFKKLERVGRLTPSSSKSSSWVNRGKVKALPGYRASAMYKREGQEDIEYLCEVCVDRAGEPVYKITTTVDGKTPSHVGKNPWEAMRLFLLSLGEDPKVHAGTRFFGFSRTDVQSELTQAARLAPEENDRYVYQDHTPQTCHGGKHGTVLWRGVVDWGNHISREERSQLGFPTGAWQTQVVTRSGVTLEWWPRYHSRRTVLAPTSSYEVDRRVERESDCPVFHIDYHPTGGRPHARRVWGNDASAVVKRLLLAIGAEPAHPYTGEKFFGLRIGNVLNHHAQHEAEGVDGDATPRRDKRPSPTGNNIVETSFHLLFPLNSAAVPTYFVLYYIPR